MIYIPEDTFCVFIVAVDLPDVICCSKIRLPSNPYNAILQLFNNNSDSMKKVSFVGFGYMLIKGIISASTESAAVVTSIGFAALARVEVQFVITTIVCYCNIQRVYFRERHKMVI